MWNNQQPNGEDWILINPDDIMPPDYGNEQIDRDLVETSAIVTTFSRKLPKLEGRINFNENGHPGQLVSSRLDKMSINNDQQLCGDIREFHSCVQLDKKIFAIGILGMFGELDEAHAFDHGNLRQLECYSCSVAYRALMGLILE